MDYFIIGDIHGHGEALEALLARAGFSERNGAWRDAETHAVFVGDLVDRGPHQLRVIDPVRRMVDAGAASICLGNHEFNAIGWATKYPDREGHYHRARTPKNRSQHAAFLAAVKEDSRRHDEVVAWFKTIPMWLDFPSFRAVHACWHPAAQETLKPFLDSANVLVDDAVHSLFRKGTNAYEAAEIVLKQSRHLSRREPTSKTRTIMSGQRPGHAGGMPRPTLTARRRWSTLTRLKACLTRRSPGRRVSSTTG